MENRHHPGEPVLNAAHYSFLRQLRRAVTEGQISEDLLQFYLDLLKPDPGAVEAIRQYLQEQDVRVIPALEEPVHTPAQEQSIPALLEQRGQLLSQREKKILTLRFLEGKDLTETAALMGLPRSRTHQIECKAIRLLSRRKNPHREKKIRDFSP